MEPKGVPDWPVPANHLTDQPYNGWIYVATTLAARQFDAAGASLPSDEPDEPRIVGSAGMDSLAVGINKLTLRAGDVVVVRVGGWQPLPAADAASIQECLTAALPDGVKALIFSGDIELTVMRDGTAVTPEPADVDAPTMVAAG